MRTKKHSLILIFFLLFNASAFAQEKEKEVLVSAASSLTDVLKEIGTVFQEKTKIKPIFNFGSSGSLYQQIEKGAPVDLFISADQETVDKGIANGVLESNTKTVLLKNTLVLVLPKSSKVRIEKIQDLQSAEIKRIAIGNPSSVPAGRYAEEVLSKDGLQKTLKDKFIPAENVRQVLDYVGREEVDAGFVYKTDALIAESKVKVALELGGHKPILYPGIVVSGTKNSADAKAFLNFLHKSPEAKALFTKYKFTLP
ncbi:molybdate ABC transporter substrate-binding protein [Leptospira langatensis]|uniref:Molybdate ABC transporter substrate-binding protein n=1 Tax=Leptospira langatensis TaxID=2484983 RepID=A0A5F1ZSU2_9LEPT|nr:molybdate ABC transporter substrate-binding protein [Leptospira langatensis]TGK02639.1 molybdate ABC transporter substrate-binding protein [Leptospira langatensis]TGL40159.1 molybdate ABC transporter substrate-binding protein [Leptospira langatensis]